MYQDKEHVESGATKDNEIYYAKSKTAMNTLKISKECFVQLSFANDQHLVFSFSFYFYSTHIAKYISTTSLNSSSYISVTWIIPQWLFFHSASFTTLLTNLIQQQTAILQTCIITIVLWKPITIMLCPISILCLLLPNPDAIHHLEHI